MKQVDNGDIGQRVKEVRKKKGYSQQELADLLGKSLRTIQKYENGEIQITIGMINSIAQKLGTTSTYLLGYETGNKPIHSLSDIYKVFFQMEKVKGLEFSIDVKKPNRDGKWQCSITFDGNLRSAEWNSSLCSFLEDWDEYRDEFRTYMISKQRYDQWKDETLAYHSNSELQLEEPEDLDRTTRLARKNKLLNKLFAETSKNE